ncbi:MAG: hypothetical protein JWL79_2678 [Frankiales bacterium]|nr:hypothetical protein [Frankiales bacterium]
MALFGRRDRGIEVEIDEVTDEDIDSFVDDLDDEQRAAEDAELLRELAAEQAGDVDDVGAGEGAGEQVRELVRPQGPWDLPDAPATDPERLDLGSLHVPVLPDTDVRLEVNPEGEVVAATLVHGESALQLNAFAAPRRAGIWVEVRAEIRDALNSGGGQATDVEGVFGPELHASVPAEVPGQGVVLSPARFLGIDGPRWFLRGLVTGPAAQDDELLAPLVAAFRQVAVSRGDEAMVVREPLPLRLPADAVEAAAEAAAEAAQQQGFQMPERGPEITEIR